MDYDTWKTTAPDDGTCEDNSCLWCDAVLKWSRPFCSLQCRAEWETRNAAAKEEEARDGS